EALRGEPKVCPHLHVPMQSGDDAVLAAMGRHYTGAEYLDTIRALRQHVPHVNVTTDVIVGFPNEDQACFQNTLDMVETAGISRVHAFSYSSRPGTAAEAMGDPVPPEEKKRRSLALRGLAEVRSRHHRTAKLARSERVLVDKVAETQCSGYSADYTRCYLPAGAAPAGELIDVLVDELHADGLRVRPRAAAAATSPTVSPPSDQAPAYPPGVCGRYTNTAGVEELNDRLGVPIVSEQGTRRYNIAPTEEVLAIVAPRGEPEARLLRWGLV